MNYLKFTPRRLAILHWLVLFLFSFFLLTFLSPDSFLMHLCTMREDSAWFFTAGKAWMEGMTPYIDFADSKGPLLWLIYGIGYLLSPTSYIGVFWISMMAYTFTFAVLWRTARLFVGKRESLIVLVLMPVLMFYSMMRCGPKISVCWEYALASIALAVRLCLRKVHRLGNMPLGLVRAWHGVCLSSGICLC